MKSLSLFTLALIVIGVVIAMNSFFTVRQDRQALVLQFGGLVTTKNLYSVDENGQEIDEAGLFWKLPWQNVIEFDRKNIGTDIERIEVFGSDQQRLNVDAFVRWRITDPVQFYQNLVTERNGQIRVANETQSSIRDILAQVAVPEIISGQRLQLMEDIKDSLNIALEDVGITTIDVRIIKADLPPEIAARVYEQMRTERLQEAQLILSEGEEEAIRIRAEADKERTVILAQAREQSETLRGEGDAQANQIYADAYTKDAEFFRFQRALIACEQSIQEGARIVVAPDNMDLCRVFIDRARLASSGQ